MSADTHHSSTLVDSDACLLQTLLDGILGVENDTQFFKCLARSFHEEKVDGQHLYHNPDNIYQIKFPANL